MVALSGSAPQCSEYAAKEDSTAAAPFSLVRPASSSLISSLYERTAAETEERDNSVILFRIHSHEIRLNNMIEIKKRKKEHKEEKVEEEQGEEEAGGRRG